MTQRVISGFSIVLAFILFGGTVAAQDLPGRPSPRPRPSPSPVAEQPQEAVAPCPNIGVMVQPSQIVRDGQPIFFVANIEGGDPKVVPTIVWSTSAGLITQGQQTRRVQVDTTGAGNTPDREIKADVWIGGYAAECAVQASSTVKVIPAAAKFGEFGEVDQATLKRNLDALAAFLVQSPDNLYLIAYAGRNSERGFAVNWVKRIREALVAAGVPNGRIYGMDGGFREQPLFDFWTVPIGSDPPRPAPTVKRSEIVYPKTTPTKKP